MDFLLLFSRWLLAAVFVVAGLSKLADRAGSQKAMRDFGLPALLAAPFGTTLPIVELVVGVSLVPITWSRWGIIGAFLLLLLFCTAIVVNLARGHRPNCHCFGQLYSTPIGAATLIRNLLLLLLTCTIILLGGGESGHTIVVYLLTLSTAKKLALVFGVMVLAVLATESWLLWHLFRHYGRLLMRVEALEKGEAPPAFGQTSAGLPVGTEAPGFRLPDLFGEMISLEELLALQKPVLLLFSDPGCGPCLALLPEIARWQREYARFFTLVLVSRGGAQANLTKTGEYGLAYIVLQEDREVSERYMSHGTPSAVLVLNDGTIGSALAQGAEEIEELVQSEARPSARRLLPMYPYPSSVPQIGQQAPDFTLPDLTGREISREELLGSPTLLLFWNLSCGFCQSMLEDLRIWDANPPEEAPRLIVVSTSSLEESSRMNLRASVVLDPDLTLGHLLGIDGTPMAILLDAEGRIASRPAAGAAEVFALANQHAIQPVTF